MEITHESIWSAVKNRGLDDSFCIGEIKYILHGKLLLILLPTQKQYFLFKRFDSCADEREDACIKYLSSLFCVEDERK